MKPLNAEPSVILPVSDEHTSFWKSPDVTASETKMILPSGCIDELDAIVDDLTEEALSSLPLDKLTSCIDFTRQVRDQLFNGIGMVLVDRIPVERYSTEQSKLLAGALGNLVAPLMPQDVSGTYLYDVLDATAADNGGKVYKRRSKTNVSQPFHTDGPWFHEPPNLVGLFCISPAKNGGLSQVSSLSEALSVVESSGRSIHTCTTPVAWNKMGEHKPTEDPTELLPIIQHSSSGTIMRHYADYVRSGFKLTDSETPENVEGLLSELDSALRRNACKAFKLTSGQFQYVNNWTLAHARAGFSDEPNGEAGRHLVRIWNRPPMRAVQSH